MPNRLKVDSDEYFPVQAFFNAVDDDSFLDMVGCLSNGVGFSVNDVDCSFPSDLDPDEQVFEGVRFSIASDDVVVSRKNCLSYLKSACAHYLSRHPIRKLEVTELLSRFDLHES